MSADSPRTEAGKRLLALMAEPWKVGTRGGEAMIENFIPYILAIEAEAASPSPVPASPDEWAALANDIRLVDGNHDLGAGALAEALTARGWTRSPVPASLVGAVEVRTGLQLTFKDHVFAVVKFDWEYATESSAGWLRIDAVETTDHE